MPDKVRRATDKELVKLENKISGIYKRSQKELKKGWADYMEESAKDISEYETAYKTALKTNDTKKIRKAKENLKDAKLRQTLMNDHYKSMINDVTTKIANVNKIALAYINDKMPMIYSMNHNAIAPTAKSLGVDFSIVNEHAVRNLIKSGDIKLPYKKLNEIKDKRWNTKKLNSSVLQGIIQGESMDKIADRILPVVDNNKSASIRNARTMVTGVENQGRFDSFKELQDMGTVIKKKWISVADDRTRIWHLVMDGQERELKDSFVDGNGNKLKYPADPDGKPETVYNCRCGIEPVIVGFKDKEGNVNYIDRTLHEETRHQKEIDKEITTRENATKKGKEENVNNSGSWINDKEAPPSYLEFTNAKDYRTAKDKYINKYGEEQYYQLKELQEKHTSDWYFGFDDVERKTEMAKRFDDTITKLQERYELANNMHLTIGEYDLVKDKLTEIQKLRATGDCAAQAWINPDTNEGVIGYFMGHGSTFDYDLKYRNEALREKKELLSVFANDSAEGIAIHEYGHLMSEYLDLGMVYEEKNSLEYYEWYKSLTKEEIKKGVSKYAATNRGEFEAECFAELQTNNPRLIAVKYGEYLMRAIKNAKK